MAGLIAKDFCLLKKRKLFFIIMFGMAWMIGVMGGNDFIVSYMGALGVMFAISTLSYDEMNEGYSFIFTLPVDIKMYVLEKFIFSFFFSVLAWFIGIVFLFFGYIFNNLEMGDIREFVILIPAFLVMSAICIPLQLKFGAEKSRLVLVLCIGIFMGFWVLIEKIMGQGMENATNQFFMALSSISDEEFTIGFFTVAIILTVISIIYSIKILNKKEL